jgi:signal transduction histidine kinase
MLCPIVVVSALDDREALEQAAFGGASAFLTKPVREDELERALELAIARFTEIQELREHKVGLEQRVMELESHVQALSRELRTANFQTAGAARYAAGLSLAHGLTHEINNALTPIIGNAQIIALLHGKDPETAERTNQIIEHARRIADWTAAFRYATMDNERERIEFSVNALARDVMELYAERLQQAGIEIESHLDRSLPPWLGQPKQMQQAFMLLLQIAMELIPKGGKVVIRTRREPNRNAILVDWSYDGTEYWAESSMSERVVSARIVRAFSGASLSVASQLIESQGGSLEWVSSAENPSTSATLQLQLPCATHNSK